MRFFHKVKKDFEYTPASITMADPNYLRKKFAAIRKKQEAERKAVEEERIAKVRKIK